MQECPCVACFHLFGTWAAFSLDICHLFPLCAGHYPLERGYADLQLARVPGKAGNAPDSSLWDPQQWQWPAPFLWSLKWRQQLAPAHIHPGGHVGSTLPPERDTEEEAPMTVQSLSSCTPINGILFL